MDMSRSTLTSNAPSLHSVVLDIAIRQGVTPAPILKGALLYKGGTVEVMITHRSVGTLFFLRDRCYHAHFQVVVIADVLTANLVPLSSIRPLAYMKNFRFGCQVFKIAWRIITYFSPPPEIGAFIFKIRAKTSL